MKSDSIKAVKQLDFFGKPTTRGVKRTRNYAEHEEQAAFVKRIYLARKRYPAVWASMYSVPNGAFLPKKINPRTGKRECLEMAKLKREGLKNGVNDLNIDLPVGKFHGLRIEFKSKTGTQTADQKAWQKIMQDNGYRYAVCTSHIQAWDLLMDYLSEK